MPKASSQRTTFPAPGENVTEGDKKGNLSSAARLGEFRELPPQALRASSPKGTPLRDAGNFIATTKSRPLGEGGIAAGDDGRGNSPAAPAGQKQCGKPPFVSVFHTGFFSPAVCGKLPGMRFQIGEKQTRKPE